MHLRESGRRRGSSNKRNPEYPNERIIMRKTVSDVFGNAKMSLEIFRFFLF